VVANSSQLVSAKNF